MRMATKMYLEAPLALHYVPIMGSTTHYNGLHMHSRRSPAAAAGEAHLATLTWGSYFILQHATQNGSDFIYPSLPKVLVTPAP